MPMSYLNALKRIESSIKEERMRRKTLISHQAVIEALDACLPGYVFIYSSNRISYSIYLYQQPGFTSEANPDLLEKLEAIETVLSPLGPVTLESSDNAADSERLFSLSTEKIEVTVSARLNPNTSLCERQISGYEEVEERKEVYVKVAKPIYKFVC